MKIVLIYFFLIISIPVVGADTNAPSSDTRPMPKITKVMNGHTLNDFKNFDKKWNLITVRYRRDTEEMRFTYANSVAYKALKKGVIDYPDGAIFGKIAIKTKEDPAFTSSVVPDGARRFQFMIRDKKKYSATNGWDYALFNAKGEVMPEDPKTQVIACAACHNIVPNRGYVFSQLLENPFQKKLNLLGDSLPLEFSTTALSKLPKNIKDMIPAEFQQVRVLTTFKNSIFQGTLDEVRPQLSAEAYDKKMPAILYNENGVRFSIMLPENIGKNCGSDEKPGVFMHSILSGFRSSEKYQEFHFCYSK